MAFGVAVVPVAVAVAVAVAVVAVAIVAVAVLLFMVTLILSCVAMLSCGSVIMMLFWRCEIRVYLSESMEWFCTSLTQWCHTLSEAMAL